MQRGGKAISSNSEYLVGVTQMGPFNQIILEKAGDLSFIIISDLSFAVKLRQECKSQAEGGHLATWIQEKY